MRIISLAVALLSPLAAQAQATDECGLYLAETVDTQGARTMGVFSSISRPAGSLVGYPDVVLPLVDIPIHNSPTHEDDPAFWWVWNDLVWDASDAGGMSEGADVKSASLGLGSLTRGNPQQTNVFLLQSRYDDSGLHRATDPGAGAISYYHGAAVVSTKEIEEGEEVFFHHGYHWYLAPEDQERVLMDSLPLNNPKVKEFWHRYEELNQKHGEALTSELRTKLWAILQESPLDTAVKRILPSSWTDAEVVSEHVKQGGKRTPEWLRKNGLCMDNLIQGPSQISQAGRGAFATRPLQAGSLIAPAPLVHILDKSSLNLYRPKIDENYKYLMSDEVIGQQLLTNYCFGHKESTKLLCPIGANTAFINHSPTPNAAIRWSSHQSHQKEWLNMTVDELGVKVDVGLVLEYYALRNLEEDEEITINYGAEWEQAWNDHVQTWSKPQGAEHYVSAEEMNNADELRLRTSDEQEKNPYPHSVVTSCYYNFIDDGRQQVDNSGRYADPKEREVWIKTFEGLDPNLPDYMFVRPCRILGREDDNEYTVQILNFDHQHADQKIPDTHLLVVKGLPRDALTFTDFAYSTDMHLPSAFRHEMMLPEGLFPNAWRNMRESVTSSRE